ncbi:hypothetical protein C2845_PM12G14640 [Panicum miliaceum]|uniref:BTB domain-containing protein n=1 Tax=Panicum miliaceum TaxID=4540 RepID=A0A3L6QD82_PANMI|nr:hypothetical protein C2845_PM12G14640 [Panicum miliaceum]
MATSAAAADDDLGYPVAFSHRREDAGDLAPSAGHQGVLAHKALPAARCIRCPFHRATTIPTAGTPTTPPSSPSTSAPMPSSKLPARCSCPMEGTDPGVIHVDDMEAQVFRFLLRCVYTDTLSDDLGIDQQGSGMAQHHTFVAADRYNLERLKLICVQGLHSVPDQTPQRPSWR